MIQTLWDVASVDAVDYQYCFVEFEDGIDLENDQRNRIKDVDNHFDDKLKENVSKICNKHENYEVYGHNFETAR